MCLVHVDQGEHFCHHQMLLNVLIRSVTSKICNLTCSWLNGVASAVITPNMPPQLTLALESYTAKVDHEKEYNASLEGYVKKIQLYVDACTCTHHVLLS